MNAKMTKLKKNYVAFVTVIAVLGVICVGLFAGNSFANENETNADYHITGKAQMYDGSPVSGATARVFLNGTGQIQGWSATSNPDGTFDVELTGISSGSYTGKLDIETTGETATCGFVAYTENPISVDDSKDFGTLTVYENQSIETYVDGERHGHWEIGVNPGHEPAWGPDQQVIARTNTISSLSKDGLVINYSGGVDFPAHADTCTLTAVPVPDPGYEVEYVTFNNCVSGEQELHVGDTIHGWANHLNARFKEASCTVNIGDNIESVIANGQEVKDGDTVPYGTTLNIVPVMHEKCVSKISVNGAINSTGVAVANGDMNISARIADAVKISGIVMADDSVANGNKEFSEIFVEKAYAAEVGVEGATVTFASNDGWSTSTLTDSYGAYALDVEKSMGGVLTISKEGFNTYTKELSDADLQDDIQVTSVLVKNVVPQTGDFSIHIYVLIALAIAGCVTYRYSRKPKGLHVK